jgi:anaerobic magnesium-protoporphyrin IX monomethyl ester cyclase
MKIALINPSDLRFQGTFKGGVVRGLPLGLAYIAGFLENEHEVKTVDLSVQNVDLKEFFSDYVPDIIGITATSASFPDGLRIAELAKSVLPSSKIVFGGSHASALPIDTIKNDVVDIVVCGEGEITMQEICNGKKLSDIDGIVYKEAEKIIQNKPRKLIEDLNTIPFPARHLFDVFAYPHHPLGKRKPHVSIMISRGCPYNCIYCSKKVFGRTYRMRSPENVCDEIEYLISKYGIKELQIIDDSFTLDKNRAIAVLKEIVRRNLDITWITPNGTRADTVDQELAYWMKKSGCHFVFFGVETGSEKVMKNIRKTYKLSQIEDAVKNCKKIGIGVGGFFMFGLPGETAEDAQKTIDFAKKLNLDACAFHPIVALPGTELYDTYKERKFIKDDDTSKYFWHTYPTVGTDTLSRDEIFYWYKKAHREFYLDPKLKTM